MTDLFSAARACLDAASADAKPALTLAMTEAFACGELVVDEDAPSPTSIRMLKFSFNAIDDGLSGQQVLMGEATRLAYGTDEAVEGRDSFLEKREPDWSPYPWQY